ncbi:hypothetical protein AU252_00240 [Pseudarthrobacter sulfonivorans]|uniref:NorR-like AAA+ ATPase lid domain-containing protein n=1 Tax=Pseudarthrobacter sulfonivorans TaxID=121292 RepID=A0A0U3PC32_9MICC|nr:hypothetical protein [Pseudarthrobacter sulfonivorans]ALV39784.1 hypothetical protein AU252_00240 [Pseudarthrobacter sulfonivorans]
MKVLLNVVDPEARHTISPAALQSMVQWNWPGNISELADTVAGLVREAKDQSSNDDTCRSIYSSHRHDAT